MHTSCGIQKEAHRQNTRLNSVVIKVIYYLRNEGLQTLSFLYFFTWSLPSTWSKRHVTTGHTWSFRGGESEGIIEWHVLSDGKKRVWWIILKNKPTCLLLVELLTNLPRWIKPHPYIWSSIGQAYQNSPYDIISNNDLELIFKQSQKSNLRIKVYINLK